MAAAVAAGRPGFDERIFDPGMLDTPTKDKLVADSLAPLDQEV
jgi:hypothetical protein